jgi:hypothetical protein
MTVLPAILAAALCGLPGSPSEAAGAETIQYNRDVRPILADTCFACHGPDSAARRADLRLDQREAAIDYGAIVPGQPDESAMIDRIFSADPDLVMPPREIHKDLTAAQKDVLRRWVEQGAPYEPHWSFIPPRRPERPAVSDPDWPRNPIDHFVLARLDAAGLTPAPEADRHTLARRVSLDLTGLPPAPEIVEQYVRDDAPDAYERLVDRLLESPHWGEHRGRYWLDYARYADTHGIHFDNYREMWAYRDWVIQAFHNNQPFDQFTVENLAGDLLPNATLDQLIGSGFNRCNMTTNEGGIIDEEYRVLYTRDRIETTAAVWLGLTANCAVCHDHKFDPLSQREFYEMSAFFNNTTQAVRDGNIKDTPPVVVVPRVQDRPRWQALETEIPAARRQVEARRHAAGAEFDLWLAGATPELFAAKLPEEGLHVHAPLSEGDDRATGVRVDSQTRSVPLHATAAWQAGHLAPHAIRVEQTGVCELAEAGDFDSDQPFSCAAWIRLPASDARGAIAARMDNDHGYRGWDFWVEGRRIGTHIIHQWNDDALKVVSASQVPADTWTHVAVTYDGSRKAAGVAVYFNGQPQKTGVQADSLQNTIRTDVPLKIGQRNTSEPITGLALQDLRIYRRTLAAHEALALAQSSRYASLVARPAEQRTAAEKGELFEWWLTTLDEAYRSLATRLAGLEREQRDLRAAGTVAHVMQERAEPATAYVLFRGEYDQRRDEVSPDTPDVLPPFPADLPRNRLGFARWLLLDDHPLTARVTVNRFWQEVFGTGIVETAGDFGVSGQLPSHPDLLDWLAVEFRESGWDVKGLFRTIVTSATYRQAATITPDKLEADPDNRLFSRGPRFRLDAEMVRDYALAASGLLVPTIGGPSVKPYQPPGVWEAIAMNVSNTRSYQPGTGEDLYRRSLYTFWKRMAPPASLEILNAPNRELCVVRRERTNTPLQALVTLNDEQSIEAARHLAQTALSTDADGGSTDQRLGLVAMRLLARPFRSDELPVVRRSLDGLLAYYGEHPEDAARLLAVGESKPDPSLDAAELAGWTMLVNALMNLDEVLNK